jgi:exodeoxyribonuclease-3
MKIVSWNVNGIRAACKNGLLEWLENEKPDLVCLQEIKAELDQFPQEITDLGYHIVAHSAEKKGYSGVAFLSKSELTDVTYGLEHQPTDSEGRVLQVDLGEFVLLNSYFPNSQRDHARLDYKVEFCKEMKRHLDSLVDSGKSVLLCGDFNIAHNDIDLKNPKTNRKNAGFLPEERAWMDVMIGEGYIDLFRHYFPDKVEEYTWWSYRPGIRERNIGWRLDYFLCNSSFVDKCESIRHRQDVLGSDHCPVELKLK